MFTLIYTHAYEKRAKQFVKRHKSLISQYQKTLELLEINPLHPSLRLQKLKGKLKALHSVSINMQCRITLHFIIKNNQIELIDIGEHDQIYRA